MGRRGGGGGGGAARSKSSSSSASEDERRLRSLLNRVRRSGGGGGSPAKSGGDGDRDGVRRAPARGAAPPPDAAGWALGRALGAEVLSRLGGGGGGGGGGSSTAAGKEAADAVLRELCSTPTLNPAIARGYFGALADEDSESEDRGGAAAVPDGWWEAWVLRCEELLVESESVAGGGGASSSASEALSAALRSHALRSFRRDAVGGGGGGGGGEGIASTYGRLKSGPARRALLRECARAAFGRPPDDSPGGGGGGGGAADDAAAARRAAAFLSPLLAASALNPSVSRGERSAFLGAILRECSAATAAGGLAALVPWLTRTLEALLDRLAGRTPGGGSGAAARAPSGGGGGDDDEEDAADTAYDFLLRLSDLARRLATTTTVVAPPPAGSDRAIGKFLDAALGNFLPRLSCGGRRYPLRPALDDVLAVLTAAGQPSASGMPALSDAAVFRTAVLGLTASDPAEVAAVLRVLGEICSCGAAGGDLMRGAIYGVGCIHADSGGGGGGGGCAEEAERLLRRLEASEGRQASRRQASHRKMGGGVCGDIGTGKEAEEEGRFHLMGMLQLLRDEGGGDGGASGDLATVVMAMSPPPQSDADSINDDGEEYDAADIAPRSAALQSAALLVGISLHRAYGLDEADGFVPAYLRSLLGRHPRLGVRLLPPLVRSIRDAIGRDDPDPRRALSTLEFLCDAPAAADADCASRIWALLSELTSPRHGLSAVIAAAVRMYPSLCRVNRRLYGRVRDSLGALIVHPGAEVRLAASATVAELAELDLIRDAADAVPWIQGRLADEEPAVAYHALMGLHHLIRNGELDFDAVIKVLNRRMPRRVDDVGGLLEMDGLVLEGLTTVLGDGQCEGGNDSSGDEEGDEDNEEAAGVSAQVRAAVRALVALGLSPCLAPATPPSSDEDGVSGREGGSFPEGGTTAFSSSTRRRIRGRVRASLAEYSVEALGVEADAVRALASSSDGPSSTTGDKDGGASAAAEEDVERLRALREIAAGVLDEAETAGGAGGGDDFDGGGGRAPRALPPTALAEKLLAFEQETLGSALFKAAGGGGGGSGRRARAATASGGGGGRPSGQASRSALAALPNRDVAEDLYRSDPCTVTSVAALLCFEAESSPPDYVEMLADLEEIASDCAMFGDLADPVLRAVAIQGWVQAMGRVWRAIPKDGGAGGGDGASVEGAARDVMGRVLGWRDAVAEPDVALVALAAFALCVPDRCGGDGDGGGGGGTDLTGFVDSVAGTLSAARLGGGFDGDDAAHACLGVAAARLLFSQEGRRAAEIVDVLVEGAGAETMGGQCFGAFYGLALIAGASAVATPLRGSAEDGPSSAAAGAAATLRRIVAFLVEELHSCLAETCPPILGFASSIASGGGPVSDLSASLLSVEETALRIEEGSRQKFRCLCVSLAQCSLSLCDLDRNFLSGLLCLMEKFPPGTGNGIFLSSAYQASSIRGIQVNREEIFRKRREEILANSTAFGLDDAFWALSGVTGSAMLSKVSTEKDSIISCINRAVALDDVQVPLFVAILGTIGTVPALIPSLHPFGSPVQLRADAKKEIVSFVLETLTKATSSGNSTCREGASLSIGLLCGMKNPPPSLGYSSKIRSKGTTGVAPEQRSGLDKKRVPKAKVGSFMKHILDVLDMLCSYQIGKESNVDLQVASILQMLKAVSLPSQFSATIEWLLKLPAENETIKLACIGLLLSQVISRQRFGMDGRDFAQLVARLSRQPHPSFISLLGGKTGPVMFMSSLSDSIPKLPSGSIRSLLENLLVISIEQDLSSSPPTHVEDFRSISCVNAFICSLRTVLKDANASSRKGSKNVERLMAPSTLTEIRSLLVDNCFPDLVRACDSHVRGVFSDAKYVDFIWQSYFEALQLMPLSWLEEKRVMTVDVSESFFASLMRIHCSVYFVCRGYFLGSRRSKEIQNAASWIARQRQHESDDGKQVVQAHRLGLIAFDLATAAAKEGEETRKNVVFHLFEVLLVEGVNNMAIELLGFLMCFWKKDLMQRFEGTLSLDTLSVLSVLFDTSIARDHFASISWGTFHLICTLFLQDLPRICSLICADLGISGAVGNRVSRILSSSETWGENKWPLQRISLLNQDISPDGEAMQRDTLLSIIS